MGFLDGYVYGIDEELRKFYQSDGKWWNDYFLKNKILDHLVDSNLDEDRKIEIVHGLLCWVGSIHPKKRKIYVKIRYKSTVKKFYFNKIEIKNERAKRVLKE